MTTQDRISELTSNHYEKVVLSNADLVYVFFDQEPDLPDYRRTTGYREIGKNTYELISVIRIRNSLSGRQVKIANNDNKHWWDCGYLYIVNNEKADEFEQSAMLVCLKYGCELEKIEVTKEYT